MKGLKSRLLTDLIRLVGTSRSGIGYTIEKAELIAKDNKYQLIDSFTEILKHLLLLMSYGWEVEFLILAFRK